MKSSKNKEKVIRTFYKITGLISLKVYYYRGINWWADGETALE